MIKNKVYVEVSKDTYEALKKVHEHAKYLHEANSKWFTKVGDKYPSFPSVIMYPYYGLDSALVELENTYKT